MLEKLENEIKIDIRIVPVSPLLIVGKNEESTEGNLIQWNRTLNGEKELFIPGSTLKGMLRNIFQTIWYDYFNLEEEKLRNTPENKKINNDKIYDYEDYMEEILKEEGEETFLENSLKISKLFGAKGLKGRLHVEDGYLELKEEEIREKSITPIDRFTGGAVVPLKFEYTKEPFKTQITVKNIKPDELKCILFAIRDSENGEVRIGSSKTRGFGEIRLEIKAVRYKVYKGFEKVLNTEDFILKEDQSMKLGKDYLYKMFVLEDKEKQFEILKKVVG